MKRYVSSCLGASNENRVYTYIRYKCNLTYFDLWLNMEDGLNSALNTLTLGWIATENLWQQPLNNLLSTYSFSVCFYV